MGGRAAGGALPESDDNGTRLSVIGRLNAPVVELPLPVAPESPGGIVEAVGFGEIEFGPV